MAVDSGNYNFQPGGQKPEPGVGPRALSTAVPSRRIAGLGRLLGRCVYILDAPHRRIVRHNLAFAYPEWSPRKVEKIARDVFRNMCTTFLEICQLSVMSRRDLMSRVEMVGAANLKTALESRKGVIMVSAHLGNWEMGLQWVSCFLEAPILGVAKKIRLEALNSRLNRLRTRFGTKIIYKKGALPEMRRALRRGEMLGLLVDQSRRSEGVEVIFFGRRVTATPAAAFLAIRCQSPVLPLFCVRRPDGRLTVEIKAPLEIKCTGNLHVDVKSNTQLITDVVEQQVRRYPEQWLWAHKRWKKFYPHLYPEYMARQRRRHMRKRR